MAHSSKRHFGIICFPSTGHLNTILPLGRELLQRGHDVTVIGVCDIQSPITSAGLGFQAMGVDQFPLGTLPKLFQKLGTLQGIAAVRYTASLVNQLAKVSLRDTREIFAREDISVAIIDQVTHEGGSVAESLDIPFISICSALPLNWHPTIPPCFTAWSYHPNFLGQLRNLYRYLWLYRLTRPLREQIAHFRQNWGLPPHDDPNEVYSSIAQLSPQIQGFEFPHPNLPSTFHFTGPFHLSHSRPQIPFPFEQLTGEPLIYASLGTLQNQLPQVFEVIAQACKGMGIQLVLSLGQEKTQSLPTLPGNPIIVKYAPQLELIQRATLVITHGGLNTALECLSYGTPMVVIPITNDQMGVSARVRWSGTGISIPLHRLNAIRLQKAIQRVLSQASYQDNAQRIQKEIQTSGGVETAVDIIERVLQIPKSWPNQHLESN